MECFEITLILCQIKEQRKGCKIQMQTRKKTHIFKADEKKKLSKTNKKNSILR